jgi:hypothetical protein
MTIESLIQNYIDQNISVEYFIAELANLYPLNEETKQIDCPSELPSEKILLVNNKIEALKLFFFNCVKDINLHNDAYMRFQISNIEDYFLKLKPVFEYIRTNEVYISNRGMFMLKNNDKQLSIFNESTYWGKFISDYTKYDVTILYNATIFVGTNEYKIVIRTDRFNLKHNHLIKDMLIKDCRDESEWQCQ